MHRKQMPIFVASGDTEQRQEQNEAARFYHSALTIILINIVSADVPVLHCLSDTCHGHSP